MEQVSYGLEVPCVYRLYGPKVYIQRMNELVSSKSRTTLTLDEQKVVHIPIFFMRESFLWAGFCWPLMETKNV